MEKEIPKTAYKAISQLRSLDIDDLYFMSYFYAGYNMNKISRILGITNPAIWARSNKIRAATGVNLYVNENQKITLTPEGIELCITASKALDVLEGHFKKSLVIISNDKIPNKRKPHDPTRNNGYLSPKI